ncbi:MAG: helicase [Stictis urceolatum]|nr:helicase [Stictis urceolata]
MKPFRPPSRIVQNAAQPTSTDRQADGAPPAKKRRVSDEEDLNATLSTAPAQYQASHPTSQGTRKPLVTVPHPNSSSTTSSQVEFENDTYYNVLWRKPTSKKHKTWDGDGILRVSRGWARLQDNESGRDLGKVACSGLLLPESMLFVSGKEVEVDSLLPREEYLRGKNFLNTAPKMSAPTMAATSLPKPKPPVKKAETQQQKEDAKKTLNAAAVSSKATQSRFTNPLLETTVLEKVEGSVPTPRHDPNAPNALVMKRPKHAPKGKQIVDVVVDPVLSKNLREHQRDGIGFIYECVMGMRDFGGQGAILADEMGLGKTLQTIALIWTLLKQNPIYESGPVIKKAVVVCPVTLINNWKKEFRKWLGYERVGVFVAESAKARITDFTRGKAYSVMIIGYERVRKMAEELQKGYGVDLIIADEGHRLKTAQNKAGVAMKNLDTARRVILSGTPIQNDLSEFFCMVDFVNPGVLGNGKSFAKQFEDPIVKSRQPEATAKEIEKGDARSEELAETTAPFILRRTADILSKYLPTKTEYVLLCKPTSAQASVYKDILSSGIFQSALGTPETHLQLITILKKICNSPKLLSIDPTVDPEKNQLSAALASSLPPGVLRNNAASSKLRVLDNLLHTIRTNTSEKVVLVSNFTATLDLLSTLLTSLSLPFLRLDGSTPSAKRQDLVDTFNRSPASAHFAFLLSAKAGGMGLNLVGASRLVLFDVDWNPAIDAQAMARIHRDGQKRPCIIYRLLMKGALDEKIWQRQVTKVGLADSVMDKKAGGSSFSRNELKDLFRLDEGIECQTHELIGCGCGGRGLADAGVEAEASVGETADEEELPELGTLIKGSQVDMDAQEERIREEQAKKRKGKGNDLLNLMSYAHIDTSGFKDRQDEDMEALVHDQALLSVLKDEENRVEFVFAKTTGG